MKQKKFGVVVFPGSNCDADCLYVLKDVLGQKAEFVWHKTSSLGDADAVVLPFRDILTSGSAILALSHGRPVIAPALGCLPGTLPSDATFLYDADAPGDRRGVGAAVGA